MEQVGYCVGNHEQDTRVAFVQDVDARRPCRTGVRQLRMAPGPLFQVFGTVTLEILRRYVLIIGREELFVDAEQTAGGGVLGVYRLA
jgi:hypothetical protein